jgi:hypothetical protein
MCFLQYRVEHRRESAWRAVDDAQHLGSCGLLLERLVTLGFALGKLTSQIGYDMRCSELANTLSGVVLICGPRRDPPSGRIIPQSTQAATGRRSGRSAECRRTTGIGASRSLPDDLAKVF